MTCTICTDLVQIADEALTSNATIDTIAEGLHAFCDILTGLEQTCKDFVDEQLPVIIELLVNEYLEPNEVCEQLTLCP